MTLDAEPGAIAKAAGELAVLDRHLRPELTCGLVATRAVEETVLAGLLDRSGFATPFTAVTWAVRRPGRDWLVIML
jgi:hypothetical protein